jgi:hypothetical protein
LTRWIAEPDTAPVEEHLLVCEEHRERLAGLDEYVKAMRAAMRPVSGPDAAAVVRHLQHLAAQLLTDDARTPSRPAASSKPRSP